MRVISLLVVAVLSCTPLFAQTSDGENFRPKTGLGLFDAELTPDRLEVTLSVFYSFLDGDPDAIPGFRAEEYRWDGKEKDEFRRTFATQVEDSWSRIYDFEHPGPPARRVEVVVRVESVAKAEEADWFVRVSKYPDESNIPAASVCDPQSAHHGGECIPYGTELDWGTVALTWPDRNPVAVFDVGIEPVTYEYRPRATEPPENLLEQYPVRLVIEGKRAARIDGWADWNEVSGTTSPDEDPSIALARERAEALRDVLDSAGAPGPIQVVVHGAFPEEASRAVTLSVFREATFLTLAHEAGHMLGLEDEAEAHSCTGAEGIGPHYAAAVQLYGFEPLFRADTDSIMSLGTVVYCRHYLPFLDALETLSSKKTGWQFAAGSAHPGGVPVCPET